MKNAILSLVFAAIVAIVTVGGLGLLASCGPIPAIGVVALGGQSCLSPQAAAGLDSGLNLRIVETLDAAAQGAITGDELTLRLRDALVTYGQELRTAIVTDTASTIAGQISTAQQVATQNGGAVGMATAALAYIAREVSWRRKRLPDIQKAAK